MEKNVSPISNIVDLEDDDRHLSSIITSISGRGSSKINAISVEQYTNVRDPHLSIKASLRPTTPPPHIINLDDYDDDDDIQVIDFKSSNIQQPPPSFGSQQRKKRTRSSSSVIEIGQSSNSKKTNSRPPPPTTTTFMCEICVEPKPTNESFHIDGCTHFYCTDCVIRYVASKLQDNVTCIRCPVPNCPGLLEPEYCRGILPQEVFERWGNALCESALLASEKFYCPYKDCSALLLRDEEEEDGEGGGEVITQTECPNCKRSFCVQCKAAWHSGIDCKEFQNLNKDEKVEEEIMMMKLAKWRKWKRCPSCKIYVARNKGCSHMTCRCGFHFCYKCGGSRTWPQYQCLCNSRRS